MNSHQRRLRRRAYNRRYGKRIALTRISCTARDVLDESCFEPISVMYGLGGKVEQMRFHSAAPVYKDGEVVAVSVGLIGSTPMDKAAFEAAVSSFKSPTSIINRRN